MATQAEDLIDDDDVLEQTDADADPEDTSEDGAGQQDDTDEDVILFGDDDRVKGEPEPESVRNLREHIKRLESDNRELRGSTKADPVGDKPTLEECDYDEEAFEARLSEWKDRERAASEATRQQEEAARRQQERWERQSTDFEAAFGGLRFAGKDSARAKVEDALPAQAIPMLVKAARGNGAGLIVALGSSPEKLATLKEHAANGDWAEMIAEAAVMAREVRVERRKPTTTPETVHGGRSGGGSGGGQAKLERLEAEAAKSGDRTALIAYKKQLRTLGK